MLVLTRRADESLQIDQSIEVRVLAIEGNRVRLGITAPRDVIVLRSELSSASEGHADEQRSSPIDRRRVPALPSWRTAMARHAV